MDKKKVSGKVNIMPLGDRVLVRPGKVGDGEKTKSGIFIPDNVEKEKPAEGVVIAVGEGRYEDGKIIPIRVKVGDKVLFSKYSYDEVKVCSEELYILKEEKIFAIIK